MAQIRTSARALIQRDGLLLVVRYRDGRGDWYTLPGGGQRHGEGLQAALVREIAEETGARVRVGPLRFVGECIAGPDSRALPLDFHQVELFFSCEVIGPEPGSGAGAVSGGGTGAAGGGSLASPAATFSMVYRSL